MSKILIITQAVDKKNPVLGFFHGWIEHIAKSAEHLEVIALSEGEHSLPKNVSVHSLGKNTGKSKIIQAIRFYYFLLRTLPRVDGVFVHMAPEYVKALYPVNLIFRKPIVMWYAHIKMSPTAKWAIPKVSKIFSPSKDSFSSESEKVVATGHGIDVEKFSPNGETKVSPSVILTQSRISRVKRLETLIEAIALLKDEFQGDFVCQIIGEPIYPDDERYLAELKKLILDKNLQDKIVWVGSIPNDSMSKYYNEATVFVRLQGGGGFGKTELESMACGTPVVLPTEVYKRVLGEFGDDTYFPEDDFRQCAEKIAGVLNWPKEKRDRFSKLARDIVVNNHNIENLAKRIVQEFNQIK